jgi:hypothetical protein
MSESEKTIAALERLEVLLEAKDRELEEARETIEELQQALEGSKDGWRCVQELQDDPELPVPRLELAYVSINEWREFKVVYRLVVRHLLGQLLGYPLGQTVSHGSGCRPDGAEDLPLRNGALAIHDSAHLGLPVYKIMPDRKPLLLDGVQLQSAGLPPGWREVEKDFYYEHESGALVYGSASGFIGAAFTRAKWRANKSSNGPMLPDLYDTKELAMAALALTR